ncbi:amino acid adenylation domain-containing protein [Salinispora fenicalii]|uniref:amino acid adenylation domain-containing protein n=1 Tax=Salinispora fenicalii TaxID=1137263 RepID=UPI00047F8814|nr:non-ribosomal peptide synthetase [Salinispora fenicalii]
MTIEELPRAETDPRLEAVRARIARAGARLRQGPAHGGGLPVQPPGPVPLAPGQAGIWFSEQLRPGTPLYSVPLAVRLTGPLDVDALRAALDAVTARHEALRTVFRLGPDGEPVQQTAPAAPVALPVIDVTEADLPQALRTAAEQPFDLERGPLLRACLHRIGAKQHVLLVTVHHIVLDGWSCGLLLADLARAYAGELPAGVAAPAFRDVAAWQHGRLAAGELDDQLRYWRQRLAGLPDLEIPGDRQRPADRDWRAHSVRRELPAATEAAVRRLAAAHDTTPFTVLLAAYGTFLHRLTGQDDFAVGVPVAGRGRTDLESVVGLFAGMVPVRLDLTGRPSFDEVLSRTVAGSRNDFAHPQIPFDRLVRELRRDRIAGSQLLVQAMAGTESTAVALTFGEAAGTEQPVDVALAKCDLDLSVLDDGDRLAVTLVAAADLFTPAAAEQLAGQFLSLLAGLTGAPDRLVSEVDLLDTDELHTVLCRWNDTARPLPAASLRERFQQWCRRTPGAVAVIEGDTTLSYRELDERANRLARLLMERGAGAETFVAVLLPRSADLLVTLLAVIKAGAAYLPIDPDFPVERIAYLLSDARPVLVVTDAATADRLGPDDITGLVVLEETDTGGYPATEPPAVPAGHSAYVIYTSGSTGRPKGVVITRAALDNFLAAMAERFPLTAEDRVLATTTVSFDIAGLELYLPLRSGAGVVLADADTARNPAALIDLAGRHRVTLAQATPTLWQALVPELSGPALAGIRVLVGGEALPAELARRLGDAGAEVTNMYGPTETTIWSTSGPTSEDSIRRGSIGVPIDNTQVYVLDANLHPAPIGVLGELHIAGEGLARGYWNRPGLTAEKFLPDPFGPPGTRMYRTGDLVRWSAAGDLEYLGRTDHQVKLRGFRIELGEIETTLINAGPVRRAAAVVREDRPGDLRLVAYVIPDGPVAPDALRTELSRTLPDYMIPAVIVPVPDFPTTPNGKLDRAALPAPDYGTRSTARPPRDDRERFLCTAFAEVLGLPEVAVSDNFFELGGHSLLAFRLLARIRDEFGAGFSLRRLLAAPTVAAVAAELAAETSTGDDAVHLAPVPRDEPLPLSPMQESIWLADQVSAGDSVYNVPLALRLIGPLDRGALRRTLNRVVDRHEMLRTRIHPGPDGMPVQVADPAGGGAALTERDAAPGTDLAQLLLAEAALGFTLATEHPLRAVLWRLDEREHVLLLTAHHVAVDAWSMDLIQRDLTELYAADTGHREPELDEPALAQADYAVWQRQSAQRGRYAAELDFWRTELTGAVATEVAGDLPRPATPGGGGGAVEFALAPRQIQGIRELARRCGTTVSTVVLSALQTLLYRITGGADVVIGSTVSGRGNPRLDNLVGCLVNTVVLRGDLSGAPTFHELLRRTHARTADALAHQELPFEHLVADRGAGNGPLFRIMYSFSSQEPAGRSAGDVDLEPVPVPVTTCKFDLVLTVVDGGSTLEGVLEYADDLYLPGTAERLVTSLTNLLAAAVRTPELAVTRLAITSESDTVRTSRWGRSEQHVGDDRTVHQLVEAQADRTPGWTALRTGDRSLTFAGLDAQANRLAHALHTGALGAPPVGPETPVLLLLDRSPELVVAMLAVLKAGGYFIPVDPGYPMARLTRIADTVTPALVLTRTGQGGCLPGAEVFGDVPVVALDRVADRLTAMPDQRPEVTVDPRGLAYSIFTSGSTGQPKGVAVEHIGIVRYLSWAAASYPTAGRRGTLAHSSVGFDLTMSALFEPLVSGRGVTLMPADATLADLAEELSGPLAYDYIRLTPSHLRHLVGHWTGQELPPAARGWVVGGETLDPALVKQLLELRPDAEVINHYGPTETVIGRVVHPVREAGELAVDSPLPLGRPLGETRLQVLDAWLEAVPVGAVGELFIGGDGIARGYLGRPALTAEKFLPDPAGEPGARMYRTGDLVRWRGDGLLDFVGRVDDQVKLRGYRIELGEIEARMAEHPGVEQAVVLVRDQQLVGWFIPAEDHPPVTVSALRRFCAEQLPEFMVPNQWVALDAFPLTPHGKVNHRALPGPTSGRPELEDRYQAPRTPGEQLLAELWSTVLGTDRIGIEDNFFDLGGTSISVIQLSGACRRAGVEISPKDVFEQPTVRGQAMRAIARSRDDAYAPVLDTVFGAGHTGTTRTVVTLRGEGDGRPVFCVHPSGGGVAWYLPLARALPAGHPVHAFQPLGMDGREAPAETIEDMAAGYLADLRLVQPEGPYVVVGWSLGGTIAFEMARQLDRLGEPVQLILLEPTLPEVARTIDLHRPARDSYLRGADLAERILRLPAGDPEGDRLRAELTRLLEDAGYSAGEISLGDALPMRACGQMLAAFAEYRPLPLPDESKVRTQFVVSAECTDATPERPSGTSHTAYGSYAAGWQKLLGRAAAPRTIHLPGIHATMLTTDRCPTVVSACVEALRTTDDVRTH